MRTIRSRRGKSKVIAFTNGLIAYGINAKGLYRIEINVFDLVIPLYEGRKRPFFRNINIIKWLVIPVLISAAPAAFLFLLLSIYTEGAVRFFKHKANITYVREFNWTNIVIVFILIVLLILK